MPLFTSSGVVNIRSSPTLQARLLLYWTRNDNKCLQGNDLCKQIANAEVQEDTSSTLVHNVIKGTTKLDLSTAIILAPDSLDTRDETGLAPIHLVILNGFCPENLAAIGMLLENGADRNLRAISGFTALHLAILRREYGFVEYLVNAGVDVNIHHMMDGSTPLISAAEQGAHHQVQLLLAAGADPLRATWTGQTALVTSYRSESMKPAVTLEMTLALVSSGANIEARDILGNTPLVQATVRDNAPLFSALSSLGARFDTTNQDGSTLLHAAAMWATWDLLLALRKVVPSLYVDPDLENVNGHTALHWLRQRIKLQEYPNSILNQRLYRQIPPITQDEIDCFRQLIAEIRKDHNFPEGRNQRRQDSVEVAGMPGGWASDAEDTSEDSDESEGEGSDDEVWETASEESV